MIQWTADGRSILYVRGGNLEQIGQAIPNPTSLAQMPDQSIWIIPFEGGTPKKLGRGSFAFGFKRRSRGIHPRFADLDDECRR